AVRGQLHVSVEAFDQLRLNPSKKVRLPVDHASTDDDPARCRGADDRMTKLRQCPGDRLPDRVIRLEIWHPVAEPRLQRRARSETFDAAAVIGARARPIVTRQPRDADMAELAMSESARRPAVDD